MSCRLSIVSIGASEMNAVDTHQKRLHDEIAAVEKEIQSHNQQVAALQPTTGKAEAGG